VALAVVSALRNSIPRVEKNLMVLPIEGEERRKNMQATDGNGGGIFMVKLQGVERLRMLGWKTSEWKLWLINND
jgi:hypothetical protein